MVDGATIAMWAMVVPLIFGSGLFSGLILGLMALTEEELTELMDSTDPVEAYRAKKILPLRKLDNWLLCTLLFVNIGFNATLSVVVDISIAPLFGSVALGISITTAFIFLFGEITPQAVCNKYGLVIGSSLTWLVWPLMFALAPICWPIGKALDWALAQDDAPKELPDATMFDDEEGAPKALQMREHRLAEVMRPLSQLPTMSEDDVLDNQAVARLAGAVRGLDLLAVTKAHQSDQVVAVLLARDVVGALGSQQPLPPLRELLGACNAYERVLRVPKSLKLELAVELMQHKGVRMLMVADVSDEAFSDESPPLAANSAIVGFVEDTELLKAHMQQAMGGDYDRPLNWLVPPSENLMSSKAGVAMRSRRRSSHHRKSAPPIPVEINMTSVVAETAST